MEKQPVQIGRIPAVLWGPASPRLFVAVHGDQASKEDATVALLAEEAWRKGFQTLSFDLPEHGGRRGEAPRCAPQHMVEELAAVLAFARGLAGSASLFGCSLGAFFCMQAFTGEEVEQALFLSPVVDLAGVIESMMAAFGVDEARLRREGVVETPAKTLYWEDYSYLRAHPIRWCSPAKLLCGRQDDICPPDVTEAFSRRCAAELTVMEQGQHYFHTPAQMAFLRQWLQKSIRD